MAESRLDNAAVLVLGMHRSGTSATAGVLYNLGVDFGPDLTPPGPDNLKGYFEHNAITLLHDELLAALGSRWDDPRILPDEWIDDYRVAPFRQRLIEILVRDFALKPLWALKDPRLCCLLPLWLPLLESLGVKAKALLVVRDPAEVAASLAVRNNIPPEQALELWLSHVLLAERNTRHLQRTLVFYEDLLGNWRDEMARITAALELPLVINNETAERVETFLADALRHHRRPQLENRGVPQFEWARVVFDALRHWRMHNVDPISQLDAVATEWELAQRAARGLTFYFVSLIAQQRSEIEQLSETVHSYKILENDLNARILELEQLVAIKDAELTAIVSSRGWKVLRGIWRLRAVIMPKGSHRERGLILFVTFCEKLWNKVSYVSGWIRKTPLILRQGLLRIWRSPFVRRIAHKPVLYRILEEIRKLITPPDVCQIQNDDIIKIARLAKTSKYDIICFPIIDWYFRFQRPQHLCSYFARRGHRAFYLNPHIKEDSLNFSVACINNTIFDVRLGAPRNLNIYRDSLHDKDVEKLFRSLVQVIDECEIDEAICIVQLPFWRPLAEKVRQQFGWKIIYDCMDEHSGFSTNSATMLSQDELLVKNADLVVVTSKKLYESKKILNKNCILVPNATDYHHFCLSISSNDKPLNHLPRPIIGYYGAIAEWFDEELIYHVAKDNPDWSIVLIGDTTGSNCLNLIRCGNVHFLGEKPYETLPSFLHQFDVCIIPFKLDKLTEATNPVKFFEYLSAGKPIVAVPLPELSPYKKSGLLYVGNTPIEFTQSIKQALAEDNENMRQTRMKFAEKNSWERRFSKLYNAISHLYPLVSVVIVTYNNANLTRLCLESILKNTLRPNIEIIVVDNGSTDDTIGYLRDIQEKIGTLKTIFNNKNLGFAAATNIGIKAANGDYIILLNNDTIVTRGWISQLLKYLEHLDDVGLVGPVTNCIGNEAQVNISYNSLSEMYNMARRYTAEHRGRFAYLDNLAMFCVAMRRNLIDRIGLLDERFEVGMFEDDDYSMRVKAEGLRLICADDVFIHHFGGSSFKKIERQRYAAILNRNRQLFEEKWAKRWEGHSYRGVDFRTQSLFHK